MIYKLNNQEAYNSDIRLLALLLKIGDSNPYFVRFQNLGHSILSDLDKVDQLKNAISISHLYPEVFLHPDLYGLLLFLGHFSSNLELKMIILDVLPRVKVANQLYKKLKSQGRTYREIIDIINEEIYKGKGMNELINEGRYEA